MLPMHGFLVPNEVICSAESLSFLAFRTTDVITTMRLVMPLSVFAVKLSILDVPSVVAMTYFSSDFFLRNVLQPLQ